MRFSLNAILMFGLGVALFAIGAYVAFIPYLRLMAIGLVLTGIGCIFCGITDGFTDPTPRGILFRRLGAGAMIIGILIAGYTAFRFL